MLYFITSRNFSRIYKTYTTGRGTEKKIAGISQITIKCIKTYQSKKKGTNRVSTTLSDATCKGKTDFSRINLD